MSSREVIPGPLVPETASSNEKAKQLVNKLVIDLQSGFIIDVEQDGDLLDPQGVLVGLKNDTSTYVVHAGRSRLKDNEYELQYFTIDEFNPDTLTFKNADLIRFWRTKFECIPEQFDSLAESLLKSSVDPELTKQIFEVVKSNGAVVRWAENTKRSLHE